MLPPVDDYKKFRRQSIGIIEIMVAVGPAVGLLACWACKNKKIKNKEEEEEKIKLKSSGQKIATEEEEEEKKYYPWL